MRLRVNKILHIFNDSPYTEKFIRFINKYFEPTEHQFIILCLNNKSKFLEFYKTQANCDVTQSKSIYFKYSQDFKSAKQIIIHQLNKPQLMASLLLFYPQAFKKMVWSIWGGDVYFYKYKSTDLKDTLMEFLRKITISKIPVISYWVKGDYDVVCNIYKTSAIGIQAKYPSPIDLDKIEQLEYKNSNNKNEIIIIVGNSADPTNEHLEVFSMLEKYKNENIKIFSILSYGGTKNYIENVIQIGKNIFKEKFIPVVDYVNFEQYLNFLNESDICILNHKRQQGLGNQLVYLALNKKLYIDSTTTPFEYYKDLKIDIFDTRDISDLSFNDFTFQTKESKDNNRTIILESMNELTIAQEWQKVFSIKQGSIK